MANIAGEAEPLQQQQEQQQSVQQEQRHTTEASSKVDLLLKPTNDVPLIKKTRWLIEREKTIFSVSSFLKKHLKLDTNESLFLYISQAFAPSQDQRIGQLFDCFGADGKLVLYYSKTPAWG